MFVQYSIQRSNRRNECGTDQGGSGYQQWPSGISDGRVSFIGSERSKRKSESGYKKFRVLTGTEETGGKSFAGIGSKKRGIL